MNLISHWIGGKAWDLPAARSLDVYDPATGLVTARVALADAGVVDEAVRAATEAASSQ